MKMVVTREEVREAFLIDDLDKYLKTIAKDLNEDLGRNEMARVVEAVKKAVEISDGTVCISKNHPARLIKAAYIMGQIEAIKSHDFATRWAFEELFETEEGETNAESGCA